MRNDELVRAMRWLGLKPGASHAQVLTAYPRILKTCNPCNLPHIKRAFVFLSKNKHLLEDLTRGTALQVLEKVLVGQRYSVVKANGDNWILELDDGLCLIAQKIRFCETEAMHRALLKAAPSLLDRSSPGYMIEGLAALGNLSFNVCSVELGDDGALIMRFEGGRQMWLPPSSTECDWHWCLNRTGSDPHRDCLVGCFDPPTVVVGNRQVPTLESKDDSRE